MKTIPLTQGKFAIVDDSDYEYLSKWKWYAHASCGCFYAKRNLSVLELRKAKIKNITMHREIMAHCKSVVDHMDGNGLNNQRCNLRECDKSLNAANSKKRKCFCTSKYKGVSYSKFGWASRLYCNGKLTWGGRHKSEKSAAMKYNEMAISAFGDFALLNDVK